MATHSLNNPKQGASLIWRIKFPEYVRVHGGCRVQCEVDDEIMWFECATHSLRPALEAFVGLMLQPALHEGARLHVEGTLDAVWKKNVQCVVEQFARWWGYSARWPVDESMVEAGCRPAKGCRKRGMFFSGGVDSFHTLLANREEIDALVFVVGFDTRLDDARHIARCIENAQSVAVACGKELVVLRSNIRRHHIFGNHDWGRSYGGALAAVAHLLGGHYEAQFISAGYNRGHSYPCGSHWKTDRYQSSADVRLIHYGDRSSRGDKVAAIGHDPVVQQHLRVCWQRHRDGINCSICEKCLRTMSALYCDGVLDQCATFDLSLTIPYCIDQLHDPMPMDMQHNWVEIFHRTEDHELRQAVRAYALRSAAQRSVTPWPWFRRAPFLHMRAHWQKWRLRWTFRLP